MNLSDGMRDKLGGSRHIKACILKQLLALVKIKIDPLVLALS
jgi:hypothetical protein